MRIRTIKPEWWSHPVMSRLNDKTRLVAIGLLNLADDEGYFMADPLFVKSQLFPFTEDSVSIHGALTTLSTIGWIEAIKHPTHGPIARVVNFRKHQKINRPTPSKIKAYWINDDSLRIHGGLTDGSLPEQGTGNREQGTGNEGSAREHEGDLFPPGHPSNIQRPSVVDDETRWRYEGHSWPWAQKLKRVGAKIGPKNWNAWERIKNDLWHDDIEAMVKFVSSISAENRWPDHVEQQFSKRRPDAIAKLNGMEVVIL